MNDDIFCLAISCHQVEVEKVVGLFQLLQLLFSLPLLCLLLPLDPILCSRQVTITSNTLPPAMQCIHIQGIFKETHDNLGLRKTCSFRRSCYLGDILFPRPLDIKALQFLDYFFRERFTPCSLVVKHLYIQIDLVLPFVSASGAKYAK